MPWRSTAERGPVFVAALPVGILRKVFILLDLALDLKCKVLKGKDLRVKYSK
jgi:hypothetical protein